MNILPTPNIDLILFGLAAIIILGFWIFVFIIFYHLVRFGIGTQPKIISALFVLGSFSLFFISTMLFLGIDWSSIFAQITYA